MGVGHCRETGLCPPIKSSPVCPVLHVQRASTKPDRVALGGLPAGEWSLDSDLRACSHQACQLEVEAEGPRRAAHRNAHSA